MLLNTAGRRHLITGLEPLTHLPLHAVAQAVVL